MILAALLLTAQLIMVPSDGKPCLDGFDTAKVGDGYGVTCPCACNSCTTYYVKVSETERRATGGGSTTLLDCSGMNPVEKVR